VSADSVFLDVGLKTEGVLPIIELQKIRKTVQLGDTLAVTIKGRDPEGYYALTIGKVARPTNWAALERAFAEKATIIGIVTGVVKVVTIDREKRRVYVGMKQLLPQPWDSGGDKYRSGERVRGTVSRVTDFGAFVELEPGIECLIHVSEMSWVKKVRKPSDLVKPGETVEAVVLSVNPGERRMSLGLKQALGDPWADAAQKFPAGSVIEGPIMNIM